MAKYSDKGRSAGILPAREKCRQDGVATKNGCHYILQSSAILPSPPWGRGWTASGVFISRDGTGEGVGFRFPI